MTYSSSLLSYADCRTAFDRALTSERGVKVITSEKGEAGRFAARCNKFRSLHREESTKIWAEGDPKYGVSPYDTVSVQVRGMEVRLVPVTPETVTIEDL